MMSESAKKKGNAPGAAARGNLYDGNFVYYAISPLCSICGARLSGAVFLGPFGI
jgi:hypothetical protein